MRRVSLSLLCLCILLVHRSGAEEPKQQKILREYWDAAYLDHVKVGHFHTVVRELENTSGKFIRSTLEMDLAINRGKNTTIQIHVESGTDETLEGKVTRVSAILPMGKGQTKISGSVKGKELHLTVSEPAHSLVQPWNDEVLGLGRQQRIFQDKKVKPGDSFRYLTFEPMINSVIGVSVTVGEEEEIEVFKVEKDGKIRTVKEKLLRAEEVPDKIKTETSEFRLPSMTLWLDKDRNIVRSQTNMDGIGTLVLQRTTREVANMANGLPPDILRALTLNRPIATPLDDTSALYRITLRGDDNPKTAFADDSHQTVKALSGNTLEIEVHPLRAPGRSDKPGKIGEEFTKSCAFLDCDNEKIKKLARKAVGNETDSWAKAKLIEGWVHRHMRGSNDASTFKASQIAENMEGDCRQHAMLTAAMCRAAAVPSRTAVGLVYAHDEQNKPGMAFHMWTEVWVRGQWVPIDATLGVGHVGVGHLKIADSSWDATNSLIPMAPVTRVFGKISIEVVSVKGPE